MKSKSCKNCSSQYVFPINFFLSSSQIAQLQWNKRLRLKLFSTPAIVPLLYWSSFSHLSFSSIFLDWNGGRNVENAQLLTFEIAFRQNVFNSILKLEIWWEIISTISIIDRHVWKVNIIDQIPTHYFPHGTPPWIMKMMK
jgi:hypothetical protein